MGLFDGLFKKKEEGIALGAPMKGKCVSLKEVNDPTFSEEILGKGVAVIPADGTVYAPADGTITTVFPTGHAVGMTTDTGAELLIHVGLDTVKLGGKHFSVKTAADQKVKKGDILVVADVDAIKAEGYDVITPLIVCDPAGYHVESVTGMEVNAGDCVVKLTK